MHTVILQENKKSNKRYGRAMIISVILPYLYACGIYRGYAWKGLLFYLIYREVDAIYDCGMYTRFFVNGPRQMKYVLNLDEGKSFGAI